MGKLRGAWVGLLQLRGNFILSEFIFPRRVQLLRPQTSKVFGEYTKEVVDWAPPHTKHNATKLNWGQYMFNLQTQLESDFQWMRPLQRDLRSIAATAATAATAAMAAAPHDGFDHAAIPNDNDALITYRGQGCPMSQRPP